MRKWSSFIKLIPCHLMLKLDKSAYIHDPAMVGRRELVSLHHARPYRCDALNEANQRGLSLLGSLLSLNELQDWKAGVVRQYNVTTRNNEAKRWIIWIHEDYVQISPFLHIYNPVIKDETFKVTIKCESKPSWYQKQVYHILSLPLQCLEYTNIGKQIKTTRYRHRDRQIDVWTDIQNTFFISLADGCVALFYHDSGSPWS